MKRLLAGIALSLVASLLFVGLASAKAPVEVQVTLSEFKVELSKTNLPAGTVVNYVITNTGKVTHELVLEKAGAVDTPLELNGKGQEAEDIEPGTTRTVEWTIPDAGNFQLACHVPGHFEAGMKALFTTDAVVTAAAPASGATQLPKTGGSETQWPAALGVLGLLVLGASLALRYRKAR